MVKIHSPPPNWLAIFAKFLCINQKKIRKNKLEEVKNIKPQRHFLKKIAKFCWRFDTEPVLLFFIVQGSLSEKLVLYSTCSPPEERNHCQCISTKHKTPTIQDMYEETEKEEEED